MTRSSALKKRVLSGVVAVILTAATGWQVTGLAAAQVDRLWSVVAHFEYENGFEFDYVLGRGLSTVEMNAMLQECARSHRTGSVVRYHCYPVAE